MNHNSAAGFGITIVSCAFALILIEAIFSLPLLIRGAHDAIVWTGIIDDAASSADTLASVAGTSIYAAFVVAFWIGIRALMFANLKS